MLKWAAYGLILSLLIKNCPKRGPTNKASIKFDNKQDKHEKDFILLRQYRSALPLIYDRSVRESYMIHDLFVRHLQ